MATPTRHALLSASASSRWLNCTAAPRFEDQFEEKEQSVYAKEGTLAHSVCELSAKYNFGEITKRKFNAGIKKLKADELWNDEMLKTGEFYAQHLYEKAMAFDEKPYAVQEVEVDFSDYVPEGFGTCDHIMIGGNTLDITDYKHGKGIRVSAKNNSQMRLYALGALKRYAFLFPGIEKVRMTIVQPRVSQEVSEECISVEALKSWGEQIKPIAQKAFYGMGEFQCGSWCRFCKGKAICKARAENYTALEDFKDCIIPNQLSEKEYEEHLNAESAGMDVPDILTDAEVANLLIRGSDLVSWYNDLKDYALGAILSGKDIPGWKVVAGRTQRVFVDTETALETIKEAGYKEEDLYEKKPKSLAKLEKLIGVDELQALVGNQIEKPMGKPTLVDVSDKRESFNAAVADFKDVVPA